MAENEAPNPLSSIISKFTQLFNFRFPPPPPPSSKKAESAGPRSDEVAEVQKPVAVKFPDNQTTSVAPVKLEPAEIEQDTNPAVLWQVYAIGGFFILKWVLARWKERRVNKKPSIEDSPPPPPPPQAEAATEPDE
uniref:heavy metal-associated isoprenylated plant protein 7-like n=1 Tax=Erigeron canadensis TaxID=72917 RepID=UPI001CB909D7|nr:heavy metal-associated isoprenylated plant protein 7-like [Erigeron canadensis]